MENIHVIAPFNLTDEQMEIIKKNKTNLPYSITFQNSVFPWKENLRKIPSSAGIIVSRGGLGEYLHKNAKIPYVHIPVTPFDLLRSVSVASKEGHQKIVVLMFDQILNQENSYLLGFNDDSVQVLSYQNNNDLESIIKRLNRENHTYVIIGDRRAVIAAEKNEVPYYLLKSGPEALQTALDQAVRTLEFKQQEKTKLKEFELIVESMQQAVVVLDKQDKVKTFNQSAQSIMPELESDRSIDDCENFSDTQSLTSYIEERKEQHNTLLEVNNQRLLANMFIIQADDKYSGAILILDKLDNIQKVELNVRKKLHDKGLTAKHTFSDIITENGSMKEIIEQSAIYARSEGTVLLEGETGTGKELFAQSIHNASKRKDKPFVAINCGSLSETLLESELFGYEEGSFTGAKRGGRQGLLEMAHGGTLFLDEINEMSLAFQAKMLRVLQEQEVRRVGGERNIPINVRFVCASNISMMYLIEEGEFKEDFYYRISTLPLYILPLRDRTDDILPLAMYFIQIEMEKENRYLKWKDKSVFNPLRYYPWYGNGRELQNIIKRLVITYSHHEITEEGIKEYLKKSVRKKEEVVIPLTGSYKEMEKILWQKLYERFDGTKEEFCKKYEISTTTLWRKISG